MAVVFGYMYRDASNFKNSGEVVFEGEYSKELEERLEAAFDSQQFFKPSRIGVPEVFLYEDGYEYDEDNDHPWHEFCGLSVAPDYKPVNDEDGRSIEDFVKQVEDEAKLGWYEENDFAMPFSPRMQTAEQGESQVMKTAVKTPKEVIDEILDSVDALKENGLIPKDVVYDVLPFVATHGNGQDCLNLLRKAEWLGEASQDRLAQSIMERGTAHEIAAFIVEADVDPLPLYNELLSRDAYEELDQDEITAVAQAISQHVMASLGQAQAKFKSDTAEQAMQDIASRPKELIIRVEGGIVQEVICDDPEFIKQSNINISVADYDLDAEVQLSTSARDISSGTIEDLEAEYGVQANSEPHGPSM